MESSHKSNIWPVIPSDPLALPGFMLRIKEIISLLEIINKTEI